MVTCLKQFIVYGVLSLVAGELRPPRCDLKLDLAVLQDTTGSYFDSLRNLTGKLPVVIENVLAVMPGSRISVGEFRDKPYVVLGDTSGFCYRQRTKGFSTDLDEIEGAYTSLWGTGGGDLPEAQLAAVVQMVYDRESLPWCTPVGVADSYGAKECSGRVVVLVTDAVPHDFDDYTLYNGADPDFPAAEGSPLPPYNMPAFPDTDLQKLTPADWNEICIRREYPTDEQFVDAMAATDTTLISLITPQSPKVQERWEEINAKLGQPDHYLQIIDANSTISFLHGLEAALDAYAEDHCPGSTRPPPTTTTPNPHTSSTALLTSTKRPTTTTTTTRPTTTTTTTPTTTTTTTHPTTKTTSTRPTTTTTTTRPTTTTTTTTTTPTTTTTTTHPTTKTTTGAHATTTELETTSTAAPTTTAATTSTAAPTTTAATTSTAAPTTTAATTATDDGATTTCDDDGSTTTSDKPHCRWPTTPTTKPECVWPKK